MANEPAGDSGVGGDAPTHDGVSAATSKILDIENEGYSKDLKKRQLQMIAIGGAIGSGLFLGTGKLLNVAGPSVIIAYAIAGFFAFIVVRALGELVVYRPASGSFVSYTREFLGEKGAFASGWMYFLVWATGGIADVTAVAIYANYWNAFNGIPQWIIALLALILVMTVNLISVRYFGEFEYWFAIIKVAAVVGFLIVGVYILGSGTEVNGNQPGPHLISDNGGMFPNGFWVMLVVLPGVVFAYAALEMVSIAAGENDNPKKIVPKATNAVIWRIGIFYLGSVLILILVLPYSSYSADESPFVTALTGIGFSQAGSIMNFVVLTAALSSVNSGLYATARILKSMSAAKSAPEFVGKMNKRNVPVGGVLLVCAFYFMGIVLNFFVPEDAFEIVLNLAALGILSTWSFIMLSHISYVRRAKKGIIERSSFRLPGAPYINYITLAFLLLVFVLMWFGGTASRITVIAAVPIAIAITIGYRFARGGIHDFEDELNEIDDPLPTDAVESDTKGSDSKNGEQ